MKRHLSHLLCMAAVLGLAHPMYLHAQYPDREKESAQRYKYKKVTIRNYLYVEKNEPFSVGFFTKEYDKKGNCISVTGYLDNGQVATKSTYKYNDQGYTIASGTDGGAGYTYSFVRDAAGHVTEEKVFNLDGTLKERHLYTFNKNGKINEDVTYTAAGQSAGKLAYTYDDAGNVSEYDEFNADGTLRLKRTAKYNRDGDGVESLTYTSENHLSSKTTYKYEGATHLLEQVEYGPDGKITSKKSYKRDQNGFETEELESDASGNPVSLSKVEYEFYP